MRSYLKDIAKSIVPFQATKSQGLMGLLAEFYLLINFCLHYGKQKIRRYSTDRNNQSLQYLGTGVIASFNFFPVAIFLGLKSVWSKLEIYDYSHCYFQDSSRHFQRLADVSFPPLLCRVKVTIKCNNRYR